MFSEEHATYGVTYLEACGFVRLQVAYYDVKFQLANKFLPVPGRRSGSRVIAMDTTDVAREPRGADGGAELVLVSSASTGTQTQY